MKLATKRKQLLAARATGALALTAGVLVSFSSCNDKKEAVTEGGPKTVDPIETPKPIATAPVSGTTQSKHFSAVAQHLDLGGTVFGYLDVDGDVETIADVAQGFFDTAKEQSGDSMPPHLKKLDFGKVLGKLGLDGIEAIGASSHQNGEMFHNKAYVHVPEGRDGLLKIAGGDPKPFVANTLAPKDADLVMEQSLDLRAGFDVVNALVSDIGGPEAAAQFRQMVSEAIPQLGLSMADLFRNLDTRITVIGRVHPDKPLEFPTEPVTIPSFDLVIALDDMGWLYEKVTTAIKKDMPPEQQAQMFVTGAGFERLSLPAVPNPEQMIAQPVMHYDLASKRVIIASAPAFLSECLAGSSNLSQNADFTKATAGLPTEGNGLSYVSERLMNEYRNILEQIMNTQPGGAAQLAPLSNMMDLLYPKAPGSQASVMVNLPEGILMVANSGQSYKESVVGVGGVTFVAVAASVAVPALQQAQRRAKESQQQAMERERELRDKIKELNEGNDPSTPDE